MYAILLLWQLASLVEALLPMSTLNSPIQALPHRMLKAARRHSDFSKRSTGISLMHDIDLVYAEDKAIGSSGSRLVSQLRLKAEKPVLFLEEYDHLLDEVECNGSTMTLTIYNTQTYKKARSVCASLANGLVVSSHFTCSDNGAHSVSNVLDLHFDDEAMRIVLDIESSTLDKEFSDMTFDLRHSDELYSVHQHDRLSRRNAEDGLIMKRSPVAQAEQTPTATAPPDTVNTASLQFEAIDTTFTLADNVSLPFDLGCKNCSGTGDLTLSTVHFEFNDLETIINGTDDDAVKSGSVEIDLTGFAMSIGLRATPVDKKASITIFEKTIIGAEIPNVAHVGLSFALDLEFQAEVNGSVELGFGFDVTVPDSKIRADFAETQNSGIEGFTPNITAKVLQSNASDVEVFLLAGLKPRLPFGVTFLKIIKLEAGPFLSLPNLNMKTTQLNTTDKGANCEANGDTADKFKESFKNLTHVAYNVGIGGGLEFPFPIPDITFASVDIPLETQCLVYQTEGSTTGLALATAALASITAPPPAPSGSGSPGSPKENDASGSLVHLSGWAYGQAFMACICAFAMTVAVL